MIPTQTFKIEITMEDILMGRPDSKYCPVALAATRAFGQPTIVQEHFMTVRMLKLDLPTHIIEFISRFDSYGPHKVEPDTFYVTLFKDEVIKNNLR